MTELTGIIEELRATADRLEGLAASRVTADPLSGVERAALAEEVASLIRHDLRNNLGSIRNAAFYLRRRTQGSDVWNADPRIEQFYRLIDESVVASTTIIEARLSLKHLFSRHITRVQARDCVARAVEHARVPPLARVELDAGPGEIVADPEEVALAVRCLIENAVEASAAVEGAVIVTAHASPDAYVITVSDEGEGIAADELGRIFDAFRTDKAGHAGLGLNVARRIARRYQGDLEVTPRARGTVAELSIPIAGPGAL